MFINTPEIREGYFFHSTHFYFIHITLKYNSKKQKQKNIKRELNKT